MIKQKPIWCPNVILLDSGNDDVFPENQAISAIKKIAELIPITTVFLHKNLNVKDNLQTIVKYDEYSISKEVQYDSSPATSEWLNAGSKNVYHVSSIMDYYRVAFIHIFDILGSNTPLVCIANNLTEHLNCAVKVYPDNSIIPDISDSAVSSQPKTLLINELINRKIEFSNRKFSITDS